MGRVQGQRAGHAGHDVALLFQVCGTPSRAVVSRVTQHSGRWCGRIVQQSAQPPEKKIEGASGRISAGSNKPEKADALWEKQLREMERCIASELNRRDRERQAPVAT